MPQLNPEFFISQIFWLCITFGCLFIFLWKYSLPRIHNVLEKRSKKINSEIEDAKNFKTEAEEIQNKIDQEIKIARENVQEMIKNSYKKIEDSNLQKIKEIDIDITKKIEDSNNQINANKSKALNEINSKLFSITKLALSKISDIQINDENIKDSINHNKAKEIL
tara:strand:+ start:13247 stop:13741 length:495 start_codon:yes stop_codon:yes gene_type:complete